MKMINLNKYIIEKLHLNKDIKLSHNLDELIDFVKDELNNNFLKTDESIYDIKIEDCNDTNFGSYKVIVFNLNVKNKDRIRQILNPLYTKIQDKNFNLNINAVWNYGGEAIKIRIL